MFNHLVTLLSYIPLLTISAGSFQKYSAHKDIHACVVEPASLQQLCTQSIELFDWA